MLLPIVIGAVAAIGMDAPVRAESILIVGASVSSGWSGKPVGEWIAEWMHLPYRNEARIAQGLTAFVDQLQVASRTIVFNLDGSYWDSYFRDCAAPVSAVRKFYEKTRSAYVVIGTVPDRNAGAFYRFVASTQTPRQGCRDQINAAIVEGCGKGCMLLDADALYRAHGPDEDIHLTPEAWRELAKVVLDSYLRDGSSYQAHQDGADLHRQASRDDGSGAVRSPHTY
jgi:hypothetical protein